MHRVGRPRGLRLPVKLGNENSNVPYFQPICDSSRVLWRQPVPADRCQSAPDLIRTEGGAPRGRAANNSDQDSRRMWFVCDWLFVKLPAGHSFSETMGWTGEEMKLHREPVRFLPLHGWSGGNRLNKCLYRSRRRIYRSRPNGHSATATLNVACKQK